MFETIWLVLDRATILIAAVFAWKAWMESSHLFETNRVAARRREALITIRLISEFGGKRRSLDLPYTPRRDQLSRQEVLGILEMYYGPDRFAPEIVRPMLESGALANVIDGKCDDSDSDELLVINVFSEIFSRIEQGVSSDIQSPAISAELRQ